MKNKFLISILTLVVFFNFTIPSYVLAAPTGNTNAFSRNVVRSEAPAPVETKPASAQGLPEYSFPGDSSFELKDSKASSASTIAFSGGAPVPQNPSGNTYYVDASAPAGGNGTQANPFQTIQQGINAVSQDGDIVQVAPGIYPDYVFISDNVNHTDCSFTLRGSPDNPSLTIIQNNMSLSMSYASNKSFVLDGFALEGTAGGSDVDLAITIKNTVIKNNNSFLTPLSLVGYEATPYTAPIVLENVTVKDNVLMSEAVRFQYCSNILLDRVKIVNNVKSSSSAEGGGAMSIYASTVTMVNSLIAYNQGFSSCGFSSKAGGITIGGGTTTIINSVIAYNTCLRTDYWGSAPGLDLFYQANVYLLNSIIWGNSYLNFPSVHYQISLSTATISSAHSDVQYGTNGVYNSYNGTLNWLSGNLGQNPTLDDPLFVNINDWQNDGFSLQLASPCAGAGISTFVFPSGGVAVSAPNIDINSNPRPVPVGTQPDMGAYEIVQDSTIYYVATNGSNSNDGLTPQTAFLTINYALTVATSGDTVQVLPGTYYEHVQFNHVGVSLIGSPNDPSLTVIDGQQTGRVITIVDPYSYSNPLSYLIKGFTIQNGKAYNSDINSEDNLGGALFGTYSSMQLKNMIIQNNAAASSGGGIYYTGSNSDSSISLSNVILANNYSGQLGGGIVVSGANNVLIDHSKIVLNKNMTGYDHGGGGAFLNSINDILIENSLIALNEKTEANCGQTLNAGGLSVSNSDDVLILNTTIANNKAFGVFDRGSGIEIGQNTNVKLMNSILWGNQCILGNWITQTQIKFHINAIGSSYSECSTAYSDIQGGSAGILGANSNNVVHWLDGNIGENAVLHDPSFINTNSWQAGGFSLQTISPCAGTGIDQYAFSSGTVVAPSEDIDANPRPVPATTEPDMGAYEINQVPPPATFIVSGTIKDSNNNNIASAQLIKVVNGSSSTISVPNGIYSFTVNSGDVVSLTPSAIGYTFPASAGGANPSWSGTVMTNTSKDFIGVVNTYIIQGTVYNQGGGILQGATVSLSTGQTTTTNASGQYTLSNVAYGWNGTIAASKTGYSIVATAPFMTLPLVSNQTQNFIGSPLTYIISGMVTLGNQGLPNVQIKEGNTVLATTNASGVYSFAKAFGWSGTVTPLLAGYAFTPANRSYTSLNSNQSAQDYTATLLTYTVSGTVLNANNQPIPGATINGQAVAADGSYAFTVNYGDSLTLTPSAIGYTFTPPSATFNNITANQTQNFVGNLLTYTVSGTVKDAANNPIATATVNGQAVAADGSYAFTVNYGDSLTLTPSAIGYSFTPPSATFNNITANQIQNFVGNLIYFNITGIVKTTTGPGAGFAINVVNNNPNLPPVSPTMTQPDGSYSLSVPYGWDGVVKPVKQGYLVIDPASGMRTYGNVVSDQIEQHYKAMLEKYTIKGIIVMGDGSGPLAGVELRDQSSNVVYAVTAPDGSYSFEQEYGWSATVVPAKANYAFDPAERAYINLQGPQDHQDYKAKKSSIVISGRIVSSPNDTIVAGVVLKDNTGTVVATTDSRGLYSFEKSVGWSGMIIPSKQGYSFTPKARKYQNVQTNLSHEDYIASTAWTSHH